MAILHGPIVHFLEIRRKALKITQIQVSKSLGVETKTYRRKVKTGSLTIDELKTLGKLMSFEVWLIPNESKIIAGS